MSDFLYSAEQVRELDRRAIEDFKIPSYDLMCRAGQVLLDIVQLRWTKSTRVLIVCGVGNNGGDGYVLARLLTTVIETNVYSPFDVELLSGDALRAYQEYAATTSKPVIVGEPPVLNDYDLIVDALFGIGLSRNIEGRIATLITSMNESGRPILAVDVPSGLNASTGSIRAVAVKAQLTATFIGQKRGFFTNDGPDCAGQVILDSLGVPDAVFETLQSSVRLLSNDVFNCIPKRANNAHKGTCGSVLLLGANFGMEGAIALAGHASLRVGAGLVRVAGRSGINSMQAKPDLMRADVTDIASLNALVKPMSVVGAGPGLGQDDWAKACFEILLRAKQPLVLDADGLNLLAHSRKPLRGSAVLTPHPAEAARLLGCSTVEIQADRFSAALAIAKHYNAVVVLKGCGSLISDGESVALCGYGNSSMACAGMGDVLTGTICGLLAQGLTLFDAAKVGVYLHALSGDYAEQAMNTGVMASDVIDFLPKALMR